MSGSFFAEQPRSLVTVLEEVGVHSGDVAEVELIGVGVRTFPHILEDNKKTRLAFCPIVEVTSLGCSRTKRRHPILTSCVHFARNSQRVIHDMQGMHGFARIACRIHANESGLRIAKLEILEFQEFRGIVHSPDSYKKFLLAN